MDKLERYRDIITRLIRTYAGYRLSNEKIESEAIIDREHDHYEVMNVGWNGQQRIHGSVIHIDLRGGKIWIQHDGTNRPVAEELLEAGVPREDIVLAFHPEELRHLTGFAVGS